MPWDAMHWQDLAPSLERPYISVFGGVAGNYRDCHALRNGKPAMARHQVSVLLMTLATASACQVQQTQW